jgi:hypothetical protein
LGVRALSIQQSYTKIRSFGTLAETTASTSVPAARLPT